MILEAHLSIRSRKVVFSRDAYLFVLLNLCNIFVTCLLIISNFLFDINSSFGLVIHHCLFYPSQQVLKTVRKEILEGCKIVFSRVFPTKFQANNHHLWKMAEQMGATCVTEVDASVTHVISTDAGTEKSRWAMREKKFLVEPRWIEAANYLWWKQPEENFLVNQSRN